MQHSTTTRTQNTLVPRLVPVLTLLAALCPTLVAAASPGDRSPTPAAGAAALLARAFPGETLDSPTDGGVLFRRTRWMEHGFGYYTLAFVANRSLRRGAWGLVPPWLSSGLIDELDIAAYGKAWVGQESWTRQKPGWYRAGWSGFVPKGSSPPPPVTGPPAELAVMVDKTGDPWLDFDASKTRHWTDLLADRKTKAPASFVRAAETESFLPRDRAAARCLMHLLLQTAPGGETFTSAGAQDALAMSDHRQQSLWLSRQAQFDGRTRGLLFNLFLETEYVQQMAEWKALAPHLDHGLQAALSASKRYPTRSRDVRQVADAFRIGLLQDASAEDEPAGSKSSRKRKRSSRR